VALGGGHGLYSSLSALRRVTRDLTAIVTVADDGGSSGRLRREYGVLPPGDLRMALAALCGDDSWGTTWSKVVQHRFAGPGELGGHAVGNLLIVALWDLLGDTVTGLDWVARLLGAHGRVLPMAAVPLELEAEVEGVDPEFPLQISTIRGQVACAKTTGQVRSMSLVPADPPACAEAVQAVAEADWVVLGPGSWFTSVIPHLLLRELGRALSTTRARIIVTLNLVPQVGETDDYAPHELLRLLRAHADQFGGLRIDAVVADTDATLDVKELSTFTRGIGARLVLSKLAADDSAERHDPKRLSEAFQQALAAAPGEGEG
jgi:uncharacterized cofD-like protein